MRARVAWVLIVVGALLSLPSIARAAEIRITVSHRPATSATLLAALGVVRGSDGVVVGARELRSSQSVSPPAGVYIVSGRVLLRRGGLLLASQGVVSQRRPTLVALHLRRGQAGAARAAADMGASGGPVITAKGVVLKGTGGQPDISLDGVIDGYLFSALTGEGVRVVDTTPEFMIAAAREEVLSGEGRLAHPFIYNPLTPTLFVRGDGELHDGKVASHLRIVDASGTIIATANASGSARDLRDVVVRAVRELADEARGKLHSKPSVTCEATGTPGCYGIQVTVDGLFDQTGGWGSGSVTAGAGHGGSINEGFDSVEHGSFGLWPAGTEFPLYAASNMGSHFDHWSGSCTGTSPVCRLTSKPNLDTTAYFAEDLWTLTVVNQNPQGGEAAGQGIGCGIRDNTCSRVLAGQTSSSDVFNLYIYPEASHQVSRLEGCDQFVGSPQDGGDCRIDMTADKTITVDFGCNPDATSPCAGQPAAADLPRGRGVERPRPVRAHGMEPVACGPLARRGSSCSAGGSRLGSLYANSHSLRPQVVDPRTVRQGQRNSSGEWPRGPASTPPATRDVRRGIESSSQ